MLRTEVLSLHRKGHSVIATVWYLNSAQELDLELLDEHNVTRLMKKESGQQNAVEKKADGLKINIKTLLAYHMLDGVELSACVDITSPHWRPRARAFMTRLIESFGEKSFQEFVRKRLGLQRLPLGYSHRRWQSNWLNRNFRLGCRGVARQQRRNAVVFVRKRGSRRLG
jgi:hypothetical protein